jgi:hypothetical protein
MIVVSSTTEGTHQPVGDESNSFGLVSFQSNSPSRKKRDLCFPVLRGWKPVLKKIKL